MWTEWLSEWMNKSYRLMFAAQHLQKWSECVFATVFEKTVELFQKRESLCFVWKAQQAGRQIVSEF